MAQAKMRREGMGGHGKAHGRRRACARKTWLLHTLTLSTDARRCEVGAHDRGITGRRERLADTRHSARRNVPTPRHTTTTHTTSTAIPPNKPTITSTLTITGNPEHSFALSALLLTVAISSFALPPWSTAVTCWALVLTLKHMATVFRTSARAGTRGAERRGGCPAKCGTGGPPSPAGHWL